MEKISMPKICNTLSIILIISFVVKSIVDYFNYSPTLNSAPFYVWILVNIFCFLIPAIIIFFVGIIIKRKIA